MGGSWTFLHGPEQHGRDWINRQRTGAYAAGQIWRECAASPWKGGLPYELAVIDRHNESLAARPASCSLGRSWEG
jgi:hypothetical protein